MHYDSIYHHRRSVRMPGFDYASGGAYYVTICTRDREHHLGDKKNNIVTLSSIGQIAKEYWFQIPNHFSNVTLDELVIMPNHIHGILFLDPRDRHVGVQNFEPLQSHQYQHVIPKSIGSIVRTFKAAVTQWCRQNGHEYFQWQRNYFEHIIRNDDELNRIQQYIQDNPRNWEEDIENVGGKIR